MNTGYHNQAATSLPTDKTNAAIEASTLYAAGFNVIPLVLGDKVTFSTKIGKECGFHYKGCLHEGSIPGICGDCNIGVVVGWTSRNLFVLDCDSQSDFKWIGEELRARGINAWVRSSERGGQYWLLCADGEVENSRYQNTDVKGNNGYVVAAESVNGDGKVYEWAEKTVELPDKVCVGALDFLNLSLKRQASKASHGLPPVARRVLAERSTEAYRGDNSRAEFAAIVSLYTAGFSQERIRAVFADYCPSHYRKLTVRNTAHWEKAVLAPGVAAGAAKLQGCPRPGHPSSRGHSSYYRVFGENYRIAEKSGSKQRAVFLAMAERMRMDGRMPFRASVRELSVLSNLSVATVNKTVRDLIEKGLIGREEAHGSLTSANRYSFMTERIGELIESGPVDMTPGPNINGVTVGHDVFSTKGIGHQGFAVFLSLRQAALTPPEIGEKAGLPLRATRRVLKRMLHLDVVAEQKSRYRLAADSLDALDIVAEQNGLSGLTQAKIDKYAVVRQLRLTSITEGHKRIWRDRHQ